MGWRVSPFSYSLLRLRSRTPTPLALLEVSEVDDNSQLQHASKTVWLWRAGALPFHWHTRNAHSSATSRPVGPRTHTPSFSSMSGIPHTVCGVSRHKERALRFLRPIEYQPSSRFLRIGRAGSIVSHLQYGSKARRMGSRAGARSLWSSSQIRQSTLFGKRTVLCQHLAGSSTTIPHTEAGRIHTRQLRKIALMADCMCCIGMA